MGSGKSIAAKWWGAIGSRAGKFRNFSQGRREGGG